MKDKSLIDYLHPQAVEMAISDNHRRTLLASAINPEWTVPSGELTWTQNLMSMGQTTTERPNTKIFPRSWAVSSENCPDVTGNLAIGALPNAAPTGADGFIVEDGTTLEIESKVITLDSSNYWGAWKKTLTGRIVREQGEEATLVNFMSYHSIKFEIGTLETMYSKARETFMVLVDKGSSGLNVVAVYRMSKEKVIELITNSNQGQRLLRGETGGSPAIDISMAEFIRNSTPYRGRFSLPQMGLENYVMKLSSNCELTYGTTEPVKNAAEHLEYLRHMLTGEDKQIVENMISTPGIGLSKVDAEMLWARALGISEEEVAKISLVTSGPLVGVPEGEDRFAYRHNIELSEVGKPKSCPHPGPTRPGTLGHVEAQNGKYRDAILVGYVGKPGHEHFAAYRIPYDVYNQHGLHLRIYICNDTWKVDDKDKFLDYRIELPVSSLQEAKNASTVGYITVGSVGAPQVKTTV